MAGRRRSAGSVEPLGDGLEAEALHGMHVEDLGDDRPFLRIGHECHSHLVAVAAVILGESVGFSPVAVRCPASGAVALLSGLAHPALRLTGELVALELVPDLLHADEHLTFGGGRIASTGRVMDDHTDLAQLPLEQPSLKAVAGEPRGVVDDDGVEAPSRLVAGLLGERRPAGPVVLRARLLVEELGDDLAVELCGVAPARLELGGAGEGLVLLVLGGGRR